MLSLSGGSLWQHLVHSTTGNRRDEVIALQGLSQTSLTLCEHCPHDRRERFPDLEMSRFCWFKARHVQVAWRRSTNKLSVKRPPPNRITALSDTSGLCFFCQAFRQLTPRILIASAFHMTNGIYFTPTLILPISLERPRSTLQGYCNKPSLMKIRSRTRCISCSRNVARSWATRSSHAIRTEQKITRRNNGKGFVRFSALISSSSYAACKIYKLHHQTYNITKTPPTKFAAAAATTAPYKLFWPC